MRGEARQSNCSGARTDRYREYSQGTGGQELQVIESGPYVRHTPLSQPTVW